MRKLITRGEIAQLMEMTGSQIRFYEKKGLISPHTDSNGYKMYDFKDLDQLELIKLLTEINTPIKEVKKIVLDERSYNYKDLLEKSYENISNEIRRLEEKRNLIDQRLKAYMAGDVNVFTIKHIPKRIVYVIKESHIDSIKKIYEMLKDNDLKYLDYETELYALTKDGIESFGLSNSKIKPKSDYITEEILEEGDYFTFLVSYSSDDVFAQCEKQFKEEAKKRNLIIEDTLIFVDHFKRKFYDKNRLIGTLQARIK